jgi:flagellar basal-body rod protein FlgB
MDITKLALDGLMLRQKAITANTANVETPDYQRKEVNFESQLREIVEKDDLKEYIKGQNSIQYNPTSIDMAVGFNQPQQLTVQKASYLQSDVYKQFNPQITDDTVSEGSETGNNVNLEKEIMDMAKVGTQYSLLSNLEQRAFKGMVDIIKGQ